MCAEYEEGVTMIYSSSSSAKQSKESKPVNKKKRFSKTPAKETESESSSKYSDIVQWYKIDQPLIDGSWIEAYLQEISHGNDNDSNQPSSSLATSGYISHNEVSPPSDENQSLGQAPGEFTMKDVNEYIKRSVGADINAKKWLEAYSGLDNVEKSEVIRLVYEVCLAKNIENDAAENEKENNKDGNFDTRRIFEILKKVNRLLLPQDRRRLVEFVCKNGNVKLLEMICQQEKKKKGHTATISEKYPRKGDFTGYETLTDLLQYVLKEPCSPEIVLCIAKRVYRTHHNVCNGRKYLEDSQIQSMEERLNQPSSIMEECLKKAIELGYKDVVSVMLSADVYYCVRLMKHKRFQEEKSFLKALDMIQETIVDVMNSWLKDEKQFREGEVQGLLAEGIEIDIKAMKINDLIDELEYRGIELSGVNRKSKKRLVEKLSGEEKIKIRIRKTAVGALVSTLFFNYQDELVGVLKDKMPLKLGISQQDRSTREKQINELNNKIDSIRFVKESVLKSIQSLNSCSHVCNNWFFREVLEKVVNEKLDKLQAVCAAICKEPMQELLRGVEANKEVMNVLKFFDVEHNKVTTYKKSYSDSSVASKFEGDIENLMKGIRELKDPWLMVDEIIEIVEGFASSKVPSFSELSRMTVIYFLDKRVKEGLTDDESKDLEEKVFKIMGVIKKRINNLADGGNCIDAEDIFRHFKIINSEIGKEDKREILEFVGQTGNVKLFGMICQQETIGKGYSEGINKKYPWKGEFTGYETLLELLQYVLKQPCSPGIVLYIAERVYGTHHTVCNGRKYLKDSQFQLMEERLNQRSSIMEECLKGAIELGYKDVVSVMLSGDIFCCIRLMKNKRFQEEKIFRNALDMIEKTVAIVLYSWVKDEKQFCEIEVQGFLEEGLEIDIEAMKINDLINELEYRGKQISSDDRKSKKRLVEKLRGEEKIRLRLRKTAVCALISTLFFNYQDELVGVLKDKKPFKIGISHSDHNRREKEINELNNKIDIVSFAKDRILKSIQLLNSSSHVSNNWFFREVLEKVVNEKLDTLQAVCAAICKEPMQEMLKCVEVHKDVIDVLKFFGVDPLVLENGMIPVARRV